VRFGPILRNQADDALGHHLYLGPGSYGCHV